MNATLTRCHPAKLVKSELLNAAMLADVPVFASFGHYSGVKGQTAGPGSLAERRSGRGRVPGVHLDRSASQTGQLFLCCCQSDSPSEVHLKRGAAAH